MEIYFYAIVGCLIIAVIVFLIRQKKKVSNAQDKDACDKLSIKNETVIGEPFSRELSIKFENLPALTEEENSRLVEIKDSNLLARIDGAIPGTFQAVANTGAVCQAGEALKEVGTLYKAVLKGGGQLVKSREIEGAVRGFVRNADGIVEQANLVAIDVQTPVQNLANLNIANAAMGAASMVVGQYYMTQINDQLNDISDGLDRIADFQNTEYKSKVYALVAEVQKTSSFQLEIMENGDLRGRELVHLKNLEHECAELLGQANLTIQKFATRKGIEYDKYERLVGEIQSWCQYQQILLEVMYKIADLTYVLNLGALSRENCYAVFMPYEKQAISTQEKLTAWHNETCNHLKIDVDAAWRERQGFGRIIMALPAMFNDDLHYKELPKRTITMIRKQTANNGKSLASDDDLFQKDVQLIAKDGKLYYLPTPSEEF